MKFVAKTLYGLERVLEEELKALGASEVRIANRAVTFTGDMEMMYRVNYCSRTCLSVLRLTDSFRVSSRDDLYSRALKIDWMSLMDPGSTFSVVPVINSRIFTHTGYPALIVKDAVADHFSNRTGRRPSVDTSDPDILINIHISEDHADISVDSSGAPLYKRGYRSGQPLAPLNEVLAAGILMLSGWNTSSALYDPMCGSGTIPVEAGLIACRVPPGRFRKKYGFMKWKDYDRDLFRRVREQCDSAIRKSPVEIRGSDISEQAVRQSLINVRNAGMADSVKIGVADFRNLEPLSGKGFLFLNPPYGERLKPEDLNQLYGMIGTTLKHSYAGYRAWVITPGRELLANIGLKPKSKQTLYNGSLECILAEFELYPGSRKHREGPKST